MLRRLPLFNMNFLLISSMACFSLGLLLNVVLLYRDVYPKRTDESRVRLGVGERVLSAVFGAVQAVLSMAGIAAVVLALLSKSDMYWVDMAVRCNLHFLTGTNVRKLKQTLRTHLLTEPPALPDPTSLCTSPLGYMACVYGYSPDGSGQRTA
jgi:hypothetical protein